MNKKAIAGLLGAASLVTLAACNNNKANNAGGESAAKTSERKFPTEVTNEGTVVKGGTINYAIVSDSPGTTLSTMNGPFPTTFVRAASEATA